MPTRRALLAALLLNASAAALAAPGDEAQPAQTAQAADEEVVLVTARRREEEVQDVPVAVSVVSGASLQATGNNNVGKLQQLLPSFQFYSTNPRNSAVNIRGLGAPFGLTNDGIEQGVGIYVDQVYYSRVASATFDFIDLERLEVLRGPQGTLYGKNTTAGAVNITTKRPSFDPEGRFELSVGNLGYFQGKASVSGPLAEDKVAARLGVTATKRNGTIFNVKTGQDVNELDNLGLRAQFLWHATDNLDLTLSGDYSYQNPTCCAQIFASVGATQRPLNRQYAALAAAFGYAPPSTNPFDRLTDLDTPLQAKQELGGLSLLAEWDLGPGTLTSVSAWRYWNWNPSNDRDFIGLPITTVSANPSRQRQWTQEFRYASNGKNRLDYVFGLFAFHQTIHTDGLQVQGPAASRWLLNPTSANANNPAVLNGLKSVNDIDFRNTSLAAFGQLTWRVTDRLRIQLGLRLNYDKKSASYVATVFNGAGQQLSCAPSLTAANSVLHDQCSVLTPQTYQPRFSDWNVSGDFTLSYDVADDVLAYATYARSFKSGGVNLSGLPLDAANQPILSAATVKPEKVDHIELGLKTQFFDRKATLNLSAYWTQIRNYQATVTNGQLGVLRGYLANADKVRVKGVEVDFSAKPSQRFTIYANGAFTDAKYVQFTDAPCPPELAGGTAVAAGQTPGAPGTPGGPSPANCDISGQWLPGISRWAASYGAEYNIPTNFLGQEGQVYLGFDGNVRSKFSSNPSRSRYTDVNGYALSNFRLGFRTDDGRWNGFAWVRNAFDVHYFELLAVQSGSTGLIVGQPGDPRTYGVTLSARF
jgi:iron complex outermembrane receptor protein